MDTPALVRPLLSLVIMGVMLPIAVPGTTWLGVAGWAVALAALSAALWILFLHARRESRDKELNWPRPRATDAHQKPR